MTEQKRERFAPGDDGRQIFWPWPRNDPEVEPAEPWARPIDPDDEPRPDWPWLRRRRRGRRAHP